MGAVQRHKFEIVRKGYEPDAVDDVILELTIAKNDAEALSAKLQRQLETASAPDNGTADAARIIAEAKDQARQIVDEAHRQAESTLGGARAEAHRALAEARSGVVGSNNGAVPAPASIERMLALAEDFEAQVTALAKSALADTSSLSVELKRLLTAQSASAPSTAEPKPEPQAARREPRDVAPARRIPEEDGAGSTLDRLRKMSAETRSQENANGTPTRAGGSDGSTADERAPEPVTARSRTTPVSEQVTAEPEVERSTSLASRIARERGSAASEEENNDRGSYYSRRSARLPRIGEEATAGAMAAIRSVRKGGDGAADDDDDDERAAQTA